MHSDCLFCKFVSGEIAVPKVFEDKNMIVIRDINPKAKNHFLLIPKVHFPLLEDMSEVEGQKFLQMIQTLKRLKGLLGLEDGFRLIINQGENGGQTVFHLHIHVLSGEKLEE